MFRNSKSAPIFTLAIVALCFAGMAHSAKAATAAPTANRPTTYNNGQAMPASDIAGYEWSCQFTPTGGTANSCGGFTGGSVTGSNPNATVTFTYPASGGKVCFQVLAKSVAGVVGDISPITTNSCKDIAALTPSAPSNVTVTITLALTLTSDSPITVAMAAPVVTKK